MHNVTTSHFERKETKFVSNKTAIYPRNRSSVCLLFVKLALLTAIPLPNKLYVALRVGVAVILSQHPTPGTIEYSTNRFCGETYVLVGVLKSQVFKLCFGAKSFVLGKKLAKLRKEEDQRSQPALTADQPRQRWDQCKFLYIGRFSIFPGAWHRQI